MADATNRGELIQKIADDYESMHQGENLARLLEHVEDSELVAWYAGKDSADILTDIELAVSVLARGGDKLAAKLSAAMVPMLADPTHQQIDAFLTHLRDAVKPYAVAAMIEAVNTELWRRAQARPLRPDPAPHGMKASDFFSARDLPAVAS